MVVAPSAGGGAVAEFLQIVTSLPTVVYTAFLGLAVAYWLFTFLGALDIEALDSLTGDLDLDVDLDVELEVDVDAEVEVDAEGGGGSTWMWLANLLRLGRIPLTVTLSLFVLGGWIISFLFAWANLRFGLGVVPGWAFLLGASVSSVLGAILFANATSRLVEPAFQKELARTQHDLLGEVCTVTTGRVDDRFGQAEVTASSDHMVIQVRCDGPGLGRGDQALIVSFDKQREAFVVEPLADAVRDHAASRQAASATNPVRSED